MVEIVTYEHKAHYYETDQMGIVHHSNYIRFLQFLFFCVGFV